MRTHNEHSARDQLTVAEARSRDDGSDNLDDVSDNDPAPATHHHAKGSNDNAPKPRCQ